MVISEVVLVISVDLGILSNHVTLVYKLKTHF